MHLIEKPLSTQELKEMAKKRFGTLVKAVVDIELEIMVIDAELHADEEALLIENGSKQSNLWGINIYPDLPNDKWLEFDSMINLKPTENNTSRGVENEQIREKIKQIVSKLVK